MNNIASVSSSFSTRKIFPFFFFLYSFPFLISNVSDCFISSHCWPYPEGILKFFRIHPYSYLTLDNASAFLCFLPFLYIISKSYGCSLSTQRALLPFNEFSLFINHVNA